MIILYILFILFFIFVVPLLVMFLIAFISNKKIENKNKRINVIKEKNLNVNCIYCHNNVGAANARYIGKEEWICHSCINKLFISISDYEGYLLFHDNEIPNFNGNQERKQKISTIRNAMSSNEWRRYNRVLLINDKTFEMIPYSDPTTGSKRSFHEDGGFGKKINIKDIVSIKIFFTWGPTDLELKMSVKALENKMSLGKRLAVANELFGTSGLIYEASKDITGPSSESRIKSAEIYFTLKNGSSTSCYINAPFDCDKGTQKFNEFIKKCSSIIDYINYLCKNTN